MEEKTKKGKMKIAGYSCLIFSAILSVLIVFTEKVTTAEALPLVYFWAGTAVTLLFGNAGKRIAGGVVQNKQAGK